MATTMPPTRHWLQAPQEASLSAEVLLSRPVEEQRERGYYHTLREICHQPGTWLRTCELILPAAALIKGSLQGICNLILTGSGSSEYVGECVRLALQTDLGMICTVVGGGTLLACGEKAFPPERPALVVSLARSGDSPESVGALSRILQEESAVHHLALTCNQKGRLATEFREHPQVSVFVLDDETNDRSLVMTSSFTNLVLAARFLGMLERPETYRALCGNLSQLAEEFLRQHFDTLAMVSGFHFGRVVYLGDGCRYGAAQESALKMLESTAGRVATMSETYLGFRHGPISFVQDDTLLVCFLSTDATLRAYECDLLREFNRKKIGMLKVVVGEDLPTELMNAGDVALECLGLGEVGDDGAVVIDAIVGQLLAFFRCLKEGLRPDSPSNGIISRVVERFELHWPVASNGMQRICANSEPAAD